MFVEVRIVFTLGGDTDRESIQGTFWNDRNVLCIGLDSGYNNYIYVQKLSNFLLKICALYMLYHDKKILRKQIIILVCQP